MRVISVIVLLAGLSACAGTRNLTLETNFPVPLVPKAQVTMGIALDEDLRGFTYNETIEGKGEWNVELGSVQQALFNNLASGMFEGHQILTEVSTSDGTIPPNIPANIDGLLKPTITDLQFSLPEQTRSDYYEVWIRYTFKLFDADGQLVTEWPLPAYGKANKKDFGNAGNGVEAAAIAACRDAMAFFAINFYKDQDIQRWLAGKPQG